jgi:hypothetical protein
VSGEPVALDEPVCPLCGGPNGCAAAASGSLKVSCWCSELILPPSALEDIPPDLRGKACICRDCALAAGARPKG